MTSNTIAEIINIPTNDIVAGNNDRKHFNQVALEELAASIKEHGLAQPPTVRETQQGKYEIVAGERRIRAMRDILNWQQIAVIIRDLDDEQAAAIMLAENTGRADLNAIEEGQAYQTRINNFGWSLQRIAAAAGVSKERIQNRLLLLTLADDIQHLVKFKQMAVSLATMLAHKELDINRQRISTRILNASGNMPVYKWRNILNRLHQEQIAEAQMGLFALESCLLDYAQNDNTPCKGRAAYTGAKADRTLPPVRNTKKDTMAPLFDRYICDLKEQGYDHAAGALANIYNLFVAKGWVTVTDKVTLPKTTEAGNVGEELHIETI